MTIIQAIVLGLVQGVTEFLPVSSSGHLKLVPYLLGWELHPLYFDVALHLGTSLAVIIYFRNIWIDLVSNFLKDLIELIKNPSPRKILEVHTLRPQTLTLLTLVAVSIPVAIAGYAIDKMFEQVLESPTLVASSLLGFSFVMLFADYVSNKNLNQKDSVTFWDALLISLSQILALIPGVSRSGATISTGLFRGLNRFKASEFSFLLSTPVILGAGILKADEIFSAGNDMFNVIIGVAVSFVSGFFAISFMLKYLKSNSLKIFIIYRLVIAIILFSIIFKSI